MASASGFRVQIQRHMQFNAVLDENIFTAPKASFPDLPDGRYAMRVRAIDTHGLEGQNADREITVKARPDPPFLQVPEDQSTQRGDRLNFIWERVGEAGGYHFQLATAESLKDPLIKERNWTNTRFASPKPLAPRKHYWRVASRRASGDLGPFGDVQQFTLKAIPMASSRPMLPRSSSMSRLNTGRCCYSCRCCSYSAKHCQAAHEYCLVAMPAPKPHPYSILTACLRSPCFRDVKPREPTKLLAAPSVPLLPRNKFKNIVQ